MLFLSHKVNRLLNKYIDYSYQEAWSRSIQSTDLKRYAQEYIKPQMQSAGFKGNKFHYYKSSGNCIFVVSFYPGVRSNKGAFSIDLGVYLPQIHNIRKINDLYQIESINCVFRSGFSDAFPNPDLKNGRNKEEAQMQLNYAFEYFMKYSKNFFSHFDNFPETLLNLSIEDIKSDLQKYRSWGICSQLWFLDLVSRLHLHVENLDIVKAICEYGISVTDKNTEGFRDIFRETLHLSNN